MELRSSLSKYSKSIDDLALFQARNCKLPKRFNAPNTLRINLHFGQVLL
jgi:hypothetical protein